MTITASTSAWRPTPDDLNTNQYFVIPLLIVIAVTVPVQALDYVRVRLLRWQEIEMRGEHQQ